ncbi:MLP-like protein 34 [Prosopis cineraria]|uniref:MLP-like protein 34 n=1 Tax=Prosopis cineraria TaxID=364024 RepID=UPI00240F3A11|nr:MLP-like protein 34 [Prosopis cineraria]
MALTGKLEIEIEIQSSATEFFNFFVKTLHNLPNVASCVHAGQLHQGDDWHAIGSAKHWTYTVDGKVVTCKERFEEIDEENKTLKIELFEGDVKEEHKSFKCIIKVTDKEGGGAVAKWSFLYEKIHAGISDPKGYLDLAKSLAKDVDAHLLSAQEGRAEN